MPEPQIAKHPPAIFSEDRVYRYSLTRQVALGLEGVCTFILLNPSTADETRNDPTINRCIHFAQALRCGTLIVVNIFAYRATDPGELKRVREELELDIVGAENDRYIIEAVEQATVPIVGWGNHGGYLGRGDEVLAMLQSLGHAPLYAFKMTKKRQPIHPLYEPNYAHRSMIRIPSGREMK